MIASQDSHSPPELDCLSDQELRELCSGRLPTHRFGTLLGHVEECPRCQLRSQQMETTTDSFLNVLGSLGSEESDAVYGEVDCQTALFQAASPSPKSLDQVIPPIETLGPYRLIRPLGRGGMGAVYLAEHERLRRKCAIKLLPKERGLDADWLERFEREMQAVASLDHPNLIVATDAGDAGGWHYLVMEYLDGLDLAAVVRRLGPLPIESAAAVMRDVCRALSSLHLAGLVHRDVKPSNVMLTRDGKVKLLDLGLVLDGQSAADTRITTVGHVLGTLAFAAPEQLSHQTNVDSRADLYGVGATLFQLITGQPPHCSDQGIGPLVLQKTQQPARPIQSLRPDVPPPLDTLVAHLLQRRPDDRPAHATDVADRLEPFASKSSLKPLVRQAVRVGETDQSILPLTSLAGTHQEPPRAHDHGRWLWWAVGWVVMMLAAFVMYVQTDRGTLVIESDQDDLQVEILRGEQSIQSLEVSAGKSQTTLRSGRYTVRLSGETDGVSLSDNSIAVLRSEKVVLTVRRTSTDAVDIDQEGLSLVGEDKLYKNRPMSYWVHLMSVERDIDTLGDAMDAIASLSDSSDVDAAHAILETTQRLGGWVMGSDDPSGQFMNRFQVAFSRLLPNPGIEAITGELPRGNQQSRSACLWQLLNYDSRSSEDDSLPGWAKDPENRTAAEKLHQVLLDLANSGEVQYGMSQDAIRSVSLSLAVALDAPLKNEVGLQKRLVAFINDTSKQQQFTRAVRMDALKQLLSTSDSTLTPVFQVSLTPTEMMAALRLGVEMEANVAVPSLLSTGNVYSTSHVRHQPERNEEFLRRLRNDSTEYADEALLWLANYAPSASMGHVDLTYTLNLNESLWQAALPEMAKHCTDPTVFVALLKRVNPPAEQRFGQPVQQAMGGYGGFGGGYGISSVTLNSEELHSVVQAAIEIAERRASEQSSD